MTSATQTLTLQTAIGTYGHTRALKDGSIYARGTPDEVLTADLLADVFEIEATVTPTEHGPQIMPLHPLHGSDREAE